VAGVLDATDGVVAFGLEGMNPIQVLQYIASGALGKASFEGGLATAGLGALLHFFIALTVAAVYVLAARNIGLLKIHWVPFGLLFGVLVYLFMSYVVVANSAVAPGPFSLALFLNGVIGHALFVGLPIAYFAQRVVAE
jgi:uncharacterized membrane protein YagU involved in acid resistance